MALLICLQVYFLDAFYFIITQKKIEESSVAFPFTNTIEIIIIKGIFDFPARVFACDITLS